MFLPKLNVYFWILLALWLAACDPMAAPLATPQTLIITAVPSNTPAVTPTPLPPTNTPAPTDTPAPTATPFPSRTNSGQVVRVDTFPSVVAGGENLRYRVYVPPCYQESGRRYPYLILLHGAASREDQWENLGVTLAADQGFTLGVLPPMIIVLPYWGSIGNDNTFPPDPSYEDVVLNELVPAIERDFCTINNREYRAIGGISRGGFWAYSIGLRHPDVFGIIGGHSAFFTSDLNLVPPAFNPTELAANSALLPQARLRLYLDNGADDPAGRAIETFSTELTRRSVPHIYVVNPTGGHDDAYWASHVSEYLAFYGRAWPRNAAELPACSEPSP